MEKVLITGGAGFIGVNLARHLLARGLEVVVFDNLSRLGSVQNLRWLKTVPADGRFRFVQGDVTLPPSSLGSEIESAQAVFHLAGQVAVTGSIADPVADFAANAQGTVNLLELVRRCKGKRPVFFYASTNKVYGKLQSLELIDSGDAYRFKCLPEGIDEQQGLDFYSPYGCSKGCADQYVRDYSRIYGLQSVVFRQSCIYGYRQFGVEDQGWVAWFVISALFGKPLTIFGDGKQVRDILFIDDLLEAFDLAWQNIEVTAGQVYNVGGGPANSISLKQLIEYLQEELERPIAVQYSNWRAGDQRVFISNVSKAARDFSWSPRTGWKSGLMKLVVWARENQQALAEILNFRTDRSPSSGTEKPTFRSESTRP